VPVFGVSRRVVLLLGGAGVVAALVVGMGTARSGDADAPPIAAPAANVVSVAVRREVARGRTVGHGRAFPSAAVPQAPATVWAVGDGANGSNEARWLARRIADGAPSRVLYLGDVYETGTADEYRTNFAGVYGGLAPIMAPTPGNHDWGNHATGSDPYWRSVTGHVTPQHYALTVGGWRIISLNSETPDDPAQLRFLDGELRRHRPRENAGRHGDQEDIEPFWRRLRGRATLVLAGHDHNLQRLRPVAGTTQFVIGAGGRERYGIDADDQRLAFGTDDRDGALRMRLRPGAASLRIVATDGTVLDQSSAACGG